MSLPASWLETLARLGVRLTREATWAYCHLGRDGYAINLPPCLEGEEAVAVLRHELQHALAGDCLPHRWPEDVPPAVRNVVADAVINASLPVPVLAAAASRMLGGHAEVVTLEAIGWNRHYTPSRQELLDWLRQQQPRGGEHGSPQESEAGEDDAAQDQGGQQQDGSQQPRQWGYDPEHPELQRDEDATPEELERAHREFVERAAKEAGRQAAAQRPLPNGDYARAAEVAATIRTAAQAVEWAAYRVGTWRVPVRTWAREGRTPQLKGQARLPRLRMAVLLDVSGSMAEHLPLMVALAELLRTRGEVQVVAFSAEAVEVRTAADLERIAGGGTVLGPAVELAASADAAVIVTDGEIADAGLRLPWPSVWILTDGGRLPGVSSEWPPVVLPLGKGGGQ
jgi:hypothetical protein